VPQHHLLPVEAPLPQTKLQKPRRAGAGSAHPPSWQAAPLGSALVPSSKDLYMQIDTSQPKHSQAMVKRLHPRNKSNGVAQRSGVLFGTGLVAVRALVLAMLGFLIDGPQVKFEENRRFAWYIARFGNQAQHSQKEHGCK